MNYKTTMYESILEEAYNESNRIVKKFKDQCTERKVSSFQFFFCYSSSKVEQH